MTSEQSGKKDETAMDGSSMQDKGIGDVSGEDMISDDDFDITGDENIDFADEDGDDSGEGGGGFKKMLAPVLVLVVAAGVGGFIVMNPQILGQGGKGDLSGGQMAYVAPESQPELFSSAPPQGGTENAAASGFGDVPPQPVVNQNENMPRMPDDITEEPDVVQAQAEPMESAPGDAAAEVPDVTESLPVVAEAVQEESADVQPPESQPVEALEQAAVQPVEVVIPEETEIAVPEGVVAPAAGEEEISAAPAAMPEIVPEPEEHEESVAGNPPGFEQATEDQANVAPDAGKEEPGAEMAQVQVMDVSGDAQPPVPEADLAEAPEENFPGEENAAGKSLIPDAVQGESQEPVKPSAPAEPVSDVYYDGMVPTGPLATAVGPRKADPATEPASQYVVVKKGHEATDFESVLASANRALKLKLYDSALGMFDQLYEKNARDPRVLMGRAVAQQHAGMTESAIRSYEQLLDIDPDNADAMLNMLGLLRQQYPSVALRRLMDLYGKHPDNAGIAAQIGVTYADLGQTAEAMRYLGMAASLEPQNALHVFNMAIIADRSGDSKQAIKYYEKALELDAVYSSGRSISREVIYDRLATLRQRR